MLGEFLRALIWAVGLVGFIAINVMLLVYLERKIAAHIQDRLGPMRVGWHGLLQPIADTIKLLAKEICAPIPRDKLLFYIAPIVVFVGAFCAYVVIPFSPTLQAKDFNLGILYLLAIGGLSAIGLLCAGWGSNNKYSLLGGLRSGAQIVSYEVALALPILAVALQAQSLSLQEIVRMQQNLWFIVYQPLGFLLFFLAGLAETNRLPFDIPEAESELVGGFHTEYSGMRFALFFLAEYANVFVVCALAVILFLGGWQGPYLPKIVWFLLKTYALVFVVIWFRWTYPRLRVDQLMSFCWKLMIPLGFANLLWVAIITCPK